MNIKVNEMQWADVAHTKVECQITNDDREADKDYHYICDATDNAPVSQFLWGYAMKHEGQITERDDVKILSGKLPVPNGFSIRNGQLRSHNETRRSIQAAINNRLDILGSGRNAIKAERDPEYAKRRNRQIDQLINIDIEQLPGYPFDVDLGYLLGDAEG